MTVHLVHLLIFLLRCRKLPKALKEWEAFNALKKKIEDFNETCPLLEMMTNKAMLERHWKRMEDLTGHQFDVESESFQLRNIMEAPLLQFREDIEVSIYRTKIIRHDEYTHEYNCKEGWHRVEGW